MPRGYIYWHSCRTSQQNGACTERGQGRRLYWQDFQTLLFCWRCVRVNCLSNRLRAPKSSERTCVRSSMQPSSLSCGPQICAPQPPLWHAFKPNATLKQVPHGNKAQNIHAAEWHTLDNKALHRSFTVCSRSTSAYQDAPPGQATRRGSNDQRCSLGTIPLPWKAPWHPYWHTCRLRC